MTWASAIYEGQVRHRRFRPVEHAFTFRMFMLYLDLDELPQVFQGTPLWSTRRTAPASFRREDFLGDPRVPLKEAVRERVAAATGRVGDGPVRMLAHLRYFGTMFNPVTFYYVFDGDGSLEHIVAEITNTPWNERHAHVLRVPQGTGNGIHRFRFSKQFHVSPFMPMDMEYDWRLAEPGEILTAHMENTRDGERVFDATLSLNRRPISPGRLNWTLLRYPFMTARVLAGIYIQAARLRLKGAPFHSHPSKTPPPLLVPQRNEDIS